MIDRRGFIGLLMGAAVAPQSVLQGLATPEPVKMALKVVSVSWTPNSALEILRELQSGKYLTVEIEVRGVEISDSEWAKRQSPGVEV